MKWLLLISASFFVAFSFPSGNLYDAEGSVEFISEAPMETIQAKSDELVGLLDMQKKTFAFSIRIKSFEGFNSPLQKEHFNEHYLKSDLYPKATFTGSLIGEFDCENCSKELVAKGKMNIHNESQIVVIPLVLNNQNGKFTAHSNFDVLLADYNISIPKILEAKISPIIKVTVEANFKQQ